MQLLYLILFQRIQYIGVGKREERRRKDERYPNDQEGIRYEV